MTITAEMEKELKEITGAGEKVTKQMNYQKQLDFDLIKRYCGQELSFRLQGALHNMDAAKVKMVNTGMVSSGKSSLYNLLTDNATTERFPTGAARTTTNADVYSYKNIEYIDTPGIDVRDADDEIAYRTVMESDIIIMVHNIKTGPLTRSESDWLTRIANGMKDSEMRKHRIVFVCTWKDTREHDQGYEDILEEVRKMVFDAVGVEIPFFDVSIKKYLDGINKGKEALCEKSGITALKTFFENYAEQYVKIKNKFALDAFEQVASEVRSSLEHSRDDKKRLIKNKKTEIQQKFSSQRCSWRDVLAYFKSRRATLNELKQELQQELRNS